MRGKESQTAYVLPVKLNVTFFFISLMCNEIYL